MKKLIALFVSICTVTSLAAGVSAATWTKVGTCGFVFNTPGKMLNVYRQRFSSIVVDAQGNIYATANNDTNTAPNEGGLTIFKAGGGVTDVNLTAQGFPGAVTKLVAAGDSDQGVVYALQNWQELQFGYATGTPHRILRIASDGSVTQIWCPKKPAESGTCPVTDANMIGGMTVGGDGNVYWTASASDGYWKYNFFYRYDVFMGVVEAAPGDSADNDGHSEKHRLFDLEYVGDG